MLIETRNMKIPGPWLKLNAARDAHFLEENQETGNQGPGNFLQEMGHQENQEKKSSFSGKNKPQFRYFQDYIHQYFSKFL